MVEFDPRSEFLHPTRPKEERVQELAARRERREINQVSYDPNDLYYINLNESPVRREDLTPQDNLPQAIELTSAEFSQLGFLRLTLGSGQQIILDSDDFPRNDVLIIYHDQLGTKKDEKDWIENHP